MTQRGKELEQVLSFSRYVPVNHRGHPFSNRLCNNCGGYSSESASYNVESAGLDLWRAVIDEGSEPLDRCPRQVQGFSTAARRIQVDG